MAKTLNQFLEGYLKVKNPDEQKFVDKHVVAKHSDRNGNDDEVFKGSKVKPIDRRKDRKGYNPGEDEKVYEETDIIESTYKFDVSGEHGKAGVDKLVKHANSKGIKAKVHTYDGPAGGNPVVHLTHKDPKALHSYVNTHMYPVRDISRHKINEELKGDQHKLDHNKNGKLDAHDFKLMRKKKKVAEEAEQIDELSKETKASYMKKAGAEIDKHWDKSKTDARSAYKYYGRKNTMKKIANEEVEELDELSHDTLRSYRMKAKSIADHGGDQRTKGRELAGRKSYGGRMAGIEKAKVMAKEEIEELDETAKVVAHLQKRYGDNIRKSHVMSAAKDFGVDASKLSKAVRTKLGKNMLGEKLDMDKASMGDVITDFKDSNAPQFKGKSQDKRRVMAIAAKLSAERGGKPLRKEEKLADLLGDLTETHRRTMLSVFDKLNEDNQKKFLEACETPDGVESMLDFSISHRGE
jgi:hypothetical protein